MISPIGTPELTTLLEEANSQNMALAEPARARLLALAQDPAAIGDSDVRAWLKNEIAIWSNEEPDAPSV